MTSEELHSLTTGHLVKNLEDGKTYNVTDGTYPPVCLYSITNKDQWEVVGRGMSASGLPVAQPHESEDWDDHSKALGESGESDRT